MKGIKFQIDNSKDVKNIKIYTINIIDCVQCANGNTGLSGLHDPRSDARKSRNALCGVVLYYCLIDWGRTPYKLSPLIPLGRSTSQLLPSSLSSIYFSLPTPPLLPLILSFFLTHSVSFSLRPYSPQSLTSLLPLPCLAVPSHS